jgi:hypothetical protein
MTNRTQEIRFAELIKNIKNHPHKEELLTIMSAQVADDTVTLQKQVIFT